MFSDKKSVRVITKLEVKSPNVIKGIQLEGLRVVGNPEHMAMRYYDHGIDEILYMDVVASLYGRNQIQETLFDAGKNIFIPLTVGGGIRTLNDIDMALNNGADKVAINTGAVNKPDIIDQACIKYGSQCIVGSIEAKKHSTGWEVLTDNGREKTGLDVRDWCRELQERGAGELLVTSVDMDGTRKGFDIELFQSVQDFIQVPIIASGGCGCVEDAVTLLKQTKVDAVCCSDLFHFERASVSDVKDAIRSSGFDVR